MQCRIVYVGISLVAVVATEQCSAEINLPMAEWHKKTDPPKVGQIVDVVYSVEHQRYELA
jgi:hypothetical protein